MEIAPQHTLLDVLRDDIGLTGSKSCCLVGECGACTVLVGDRSVDACLVLGVRGGGLDRDHGRGPRVGGGTPALRSRPAFLATGAAQCGFCIPGQLMAAAELLGHYAAPHPGPRSRTASPATTVGAPATSRSSRPSSWRPSCWRPGNRPPRGRPDGAGASAILSRPGVGGIDRVTGRQCLRRRPTRRRPPRQACHDSRARARIVVDRHDGRPRRAGRAPRLHRRRSAAAGRAVLDPSSGTAP